MRSVIDWEREYMLNKLIKEIFDNCYTISWDKFWIRICVKKRRL